MSSSDIWELITGVIIIAIILVLVRPNSPGPTAVNQIANALTSLIQTATDYESQGQ